MKQQKIIPKEKKFRFVKSHKKDVCPITNEIVEYWKCSNCKHRGDMSWVTKSKIGIEKFTTKCGFPLIWKRYKGWISEKE